jgi:hypothetical protein
MKPRSVSTKDKGHPSQRTMVRTGYVLLSTPGVKYISLNSHAGKQISVLLPGPIIHL